MIRNFDKRLSSLQQSQGIGKGSTQQYLNVNRPSIPEPQPEDLRWLAPLYNKIGKVAVLRNDHNFTEPSGCIEQDRIGCIAKSKFDNRLGNHLELTTKPLGQHRVKLRVNPECHKDATSRG